MGEGKGAQENFVDEEEVDVRKHCGGGGGRRKKTLWTREGGARNIVGEGKGGARKHSAGR